MKIPFFKELSGRLYQEEVLFNARQPAKHEFAVTSEWRIIVPSSSSVQILIAANDLKEFFKAKAGMYIGIHKGLKDNNKPKKVIYLVINSALAKDNQPESYRIACAPEEITVEGVDADGVMHGVFYLEELMKFKQAPIFKHQTIKRSPILETRIFRSPMAFFYENELLKVEKAYPDNYLCKLAHHGFNGVFLRGILRELVKTGVFPELGEKSDYFLYKLERLVKRCQRYGIKVYLYFTEPLGFEKNDVFWSRRPHLKGEYSGLESSYACCSSRPEVKRFLHEGMKYLFTEVSGLGGVILITASETHSHCYSHIDMANAIKDGIARANNVSCPLCSKRTPQEVIGEIVGLINGGIKEVAPQAKVIAWNWSWSMYGEGAQSQIIQKMPQDVIIMGDFERGGKKRKTGYFAADIDEYSLTYVGPSRRFQALRKTAQKYKHTVYAKLTIGTTHEIATVPFLPLYYKLVRKFISLKNMGIKGAMECWIFGNILSHNTELANYFSWQPQPVTARHILQQIAIRDFGEKAAGYFLKAWQYFDKASDYYPFDMAFLYWGPQNHGGAYPLFLTKKNMPMPMSWLLPREVNYNMQAMDITKRCEYGDRIQDCCRGIGPVQTIRSLRTLCKIWENGIKLLENGLKLVPAEFRKNAIFEFTTAAAVWSQFKSALNFIEFTYIRDKTNCKKRLLGMRKIELIVKNEIENSLFLKKLCRQNAMLGFHGEAQGYFYTPLKIDKKIKQTKVIRENIRTIPV